MLKNFQRYVRHTGCNLLRICKKRASNPIVYFLLAMIVCFSQILVSLFCYFYTQHLYLRELLVPQDLMDHQEILDQQDQQETKDK